MIVEVIGSVAAGLMAGSAALLAFGGDSVIELISGIAVLRFLTNGSQTGHKTERITSGLLFALIPVIGLGTAYSYFTGLRAEASPIGIVVAVGAVIIMPYLWYEKRKIGAEIRTVPLTIDAVESLTCLFMAMALLAGLLPVFLFGLWWFDYVATAVILVFVMKEAVESYRELRESG